MYYSSGYSFDITIATSLDQVQHRISMPLTASGCLDTTVVESVCGGVNAGDPTGLDSQAMDCLVPTHHIGSSCSRFSSCNHGAVGAGGKKRIVTISTPIRFL